MGRMDRFAGCVKPHRRRWETRVRRFQGSGSRGSGFRGLSNPDELSTLNPEPEPQRLNPEPGQNVSFAASCMIRSPVLRSGRPKVVVLVNVVPETL